MIRPDMNVIQRWNTVKVSDLPELLKSQGFHFVKSFSTDEHRIFVSQDNSLMIIFERNVGKVYSTRNRKQSLHSFTVVPEGPKLNQIKRAE
ncbi:hypothetical protein pEaSNUABM50_00552 [Erwinia phage pEa_SNUABM_50]|uniref:Uncharacterized protein n=1 Tax=Erwinia phage pEa_SNUABM_50 TaxID=2768775 RepID=A0A7L8ZQK0_9CAUD|nr:hypothetical protein pEaSNUABM50_00552 [Erwinia phage pEa_SNUABM_50]QXO12224.1 hypothetical protein pEaSNUABM44_00563 [Erwinia phage pEa_SNUABM_44]QXO12778.1 hypothetical protein pEaSNUABM49_00565 [Erwinia phage pEa_SNUABM_49]